MLSLSGVPMWSRVEDAHRGRASQGDRDLEYDEDVDTQGDIRRKPPKFGARNCSLLIESRRSCHLYSVVGSIGNLGRSWDGRQTWIR